MHRPDSQSGPGPIGPEFHCARATRWEEEELHRSLGREEWASKGGGGE